MSSSGSATWYFWRPRHNHVESGDRACADRYRVGSYATAAQRQRALEKVAERNEQWEAEDTPAGQATRHATFL
jgi:hypothetical protein